MGAKTEEELRAMGLTPPDENEAQEKAQAELAKAARLEQDRRVHGASFTGSDGERIDPKDVVPVPAVDGRVQLWLAPFKSQVEEGFEALVAAFEDDQLVEALQPLAAHLLVAAGSALNRMDDVHPAILELTRVKKNDAPAGDISGRAGTSAPDFSGGPLYTFEGSTPADRPNVFLWQLAEVRTYYDPKREYSGRALYKHRENRAGGPIVGVADKRFTVYIGRTVKA